MKVLPFFLLCAVSMAHGAKHKTTIELINEESRQLKHALKTIKVTLADRVSQKDTAARIAQARKSKCYVKQCLGRLGAIHTALKIQNPSEDNLRKEFEIYKACREELFERLTALNKV